MDRRGFLKRFGVLAGGMAATAIPVSGATAKNEPKGDFLKKTWEKDGITFFEYELPKDIPATFTNKKRGRAFYCPMYDISDNSGQQKVEKAVKTLQGHQRGAQREKESTLDPKYSGPKYFDGWLNPYCYIVKIKDRPDLMGILVNKDKLELERDAYTIYNAKD